MTQTLVMTGRTLRHWRAKPGNLVMILFFPLLMLFMMGGIFGGALSGGFGAYLNILMPGMLAMTTMQGISYTMQMVVTDAEKGVTDRFRSLPINASSIIGGRVLADTIQIVLTLLVLTGVGLIFGWRLPAAPGPIAAAYGLLLLFGIAVTWLGIALALPADQSLINASYIFVWPLSFISSVFVDPATMPGWLATIAGWNPVSATTDAVRLLTGSPMGHPTALPAQYPIVFAILWPMLVLAIAIPLAARNYRRLSR